MPTDTDERIKEWKEVHQPFELEWHKNDNYRWRDDEFNLSWTQNFGNFLGLAPDHFGPGDILLDVGCGSRSAFSYFERGIKFYVDPLGDEYLKIPQVQKYWDDPDRLIRVPAEKLIRDFVGRCAFVNCWNVLDHCYDWRTVLRNLILYARHGGIIALCTDTKSHGDGHPGIDCPHELIQMIVRRCSIEILEINYGDSVVRDLAMKLRKVRL